ncbi:MAG TPA: hypothetical protein VF843_06230 [Streptosporangiaceae bacterium]
MPLFPARPADTTPAHPIRRQVIAAGGAVAVAAELAIAPVTLGATLLALVVCRLTRWRPAWLVAPAAAGAAVALWHGPGRAVSGFVAGGAHLAVFLAGPGAVPAHLARLPGLAGRWRAGLASQLPLAVIAAAAQAAVVVTRRDGRYRPGLVCALRRSYQAALLRRGEVATVTGARIGLDRVTGRGMTVSWAEASGGVLVTGRQPGAVTGTALDLVVAAIQHRKAVLVVDLGGQPARVAAAIASASSDRQAPVRNWPPDQNRGQILAAVLAGRAVLLAQPAPQAAAAESARGLTRELAAVLAGRQAIGAPADVLIWINSFDRLGRDSVTWLLGSGALGRPPAALVLSTSSGPAAEWVAGQVAVVAVRGRPPLDWPPEPDREPAGPAAPLPARLLAGRGDADLALQVRAPVPRLQDGGRAVRTW